MFRTVDSVRLLQAVAAIAGLAVLLWSLGLPSIRIADAANVTDFSDTISTSATGTAAYHEISYVIPNGSAGVEVNESISITFPNGFTGSSTVIADDLDLSVGGVDFPVVASGGEGAGDWGFSWTNNTLTFQSGGGNASATANATVTIQIGSNATFGANGTDRLVNPTTANSYQISVVSGDGANNDTGTTHVVILSTVLITASVDTVFNFTVAGLSAGEDVNGTTTTGDTTATAIPFGTLQAGAANATITAQRLTVGTNAAGGYVVTAELDGYLDSSTGADIDPFNDNDTPAPWTSPSGTLGQENTYGHWGITSEDSTTTRTNQFSQSQTQWIGASTSPRVIMSHDGPANLTGTGIGTADIGFKIEITALQEAADDYDAILTYIATPTF